MSNYHKSLFSIFCISFLICISCQHNQLKKHNIDSIGLEKKYTNSVGMEFVLIPEGKFMMGCSNPGKDLGSCVPSEEPQHEVTISRSFYLGKYEVTQKQWNAVMGSNPSKFKNLSNPVENITWDDVQDFIRKLNVKEGWNKYRLPTEAEWEYAASAGSMTVICYEYGSEDLVDQYVQCFNQYAWWWGNSEENHQRKAHQVGQKKPNAWGLYDMHGNVQEWVNDYYDDNYYGNSSSIDPIGPSSSTLRVLRGGSYASFARFCWSTYREYRVPDGKDDDIGFRLVCSSEQ